MNITLTLNPPITILEPGNDGIIKAVCDVNGAKRVIGKGYTQANALNDLREKLRRYLNGIFW